MSTKTFTDFVKSLKGSSSTLYSNFDLTWGIPNSLAISNQMLIFLLAKTSIIPFIEDYTQVSSQLGLTSEQAASIQGINNDLLTLQRMIIQNCMQQYLVGSLVKSKIDEIILSFPEIKDIKSIDDFTEYIENFKGTQIAGGQKGGCCGQLTSMILFLFLLMVLSTPSSAGWFDSSTPTLTPTPQEEPTKDVAVFKGRPGAIVSVDPNSGLSFFNSEVATLGVFEFAKNIRELTPQTSSQHDLGGALTAWSPEQKNTIQKMYKSVMVLLDMDKAGPESGSEALNILINDINEQLRNFSNGAEAQCINLMEIANRNGAFKDFQDYADTSEIIDQINNAEKRMKDLEEEEADRLIREGAKDVISTTAAAATVGSVFPVVGTAVGAGIGFVGSTAVNLYGYMQNSKTYVRMREDYKSTALSTNPYNQLTIQERTHYKEQAYGFSKVYCSYGFKLKLKRTNDSIQLIGSNVNYENIVTLIESLKSNIELSITAQISKPENEKTIAILDSLYQRLEVLSAISRKVSDVVQFAADSKMIMLDDRPDTIPEIKNIFDEQLASLNELLSQVKQGRPLSLQQAKNSLDIQKAKVLEQDVEDETKGFAREITRKKTESYALDAQATNNATTVVVQSWTETFGAPVEGVFGGLSSVTGKITSAIITNLFKHFNTWALVSGGLIALLLAGSALSGNTFIFRTVKGTIFWVISLPGQIGRGMYLIYECVLCPSFGWICKKVGLVVQRGPPAVGPPAQDVGQGPPAVGQPDQDLGQGDLVIAPGPQGVGQGDLVVAPGPQGVGPAAQAVGQAADGAMVLVGGPAPNINNIDGGRKTRKMRKLKRKISKNKTKKRISKNKTKKRILKARRRRLTKHRK